MSIQVGIIGCGKQGLNHARVLSNLEGFRLVAACDPTPQSRDAFAAVHPQVTMYADTQEMLGNDDLDLVVVVTPTTSHAPLSIAGMRAGMHVVCEKPMCLNSSEALQIADVSLETGKFFSVYQNRRGDDYFLRARHVIEQGLVGAVRDLRIVRSAWRAGSMVWGSAHFRPQWRSERAFGGGMLYDWGGHWIDQALLLHRAKVASVYCRLFFGGIVPGQDAEDGFRLLLTYEDGVSAHIEFQAGSLGELDTNGWIVSGTSGGLSSGKLVQLENPDDPLASKVRESSLEENLPAFRFWEAMREAIEAEDRSLLPVQVEESLRVMRIVDAAFDSHETGQVVRLDPWV